MKDTHETLGPLTIEDIRVLTIIYQNIAEAFTGTRDMKQLLQKIDDYRSQGEKMNTPRIVEAREFVATMIHSKELFERTFFEDDKVVNVDKHLYKISTEEGEHTT